MNFTDFQKEIIARINNGKIKSLADFLWLYRDGDDIGERIDTLIKDIGDRRTIIPNFGFPLKGSNIIRSLSLPDQKTDSQLIEFVQVVKFLLSHDMVATQTSQLQVAEPPDLYTSFPFVSSVIHAYNNQYIIAIPTLQRFIDKNYFTDLELAEQRANQAEQRAGQEETDRKIAQRWTIILATVSIVCSIASIVFNEFGSTDVRIDNSSGTMKPIPIKILINADTNKTTSK